MYRDQLAQDPAFYNTWNRRVYHPSEAASFVRRTPDELEDFEIAVRNEAAWLTEGRSMEWSVLEYGLYGPQLRRYLQQFPRAQIFILDSCQLRFRRVATLNRVLAFLGVEPWNWSQADLSEVFVSPVVGPMPGRARDFLHEFYATSNRMLDGLLDPLPAWAGARTSSRTQGAA
jgi:hypothetical protein